MFATYLKWYHLVSEAASGSSTYYHVEKNHDFMAIRRRCDPLQESRFVCDLFECYEGATKARYLFYVDTMFSAGCRSRATV